MRNTGNNSKPIGFQNRFDAFDKRKNNRGFEHENNFQEVNQQNSFTRFFPRFSRERIFFSSTMIFFTHLFLPSFFSLELSKQKKEKYMHLLVALCLAALLSCGWCFPFSKTSGVTELTPQTLPGFLNTHKPVFIMFYAPWCGHCKSMHPEYEKFAKGVKDVVRVGALNADQYKEIGGQFGIKGFPTIKYWKIGPKKGQKPQEYSSGRTGAALQSAAVAEITSVYVQSVSTSDQLSALTGKVASGKVVVLLTNKAKSPPMFSVLSHSPHFNGKLGFAVVTEKAKKLAEELGVSKFPTIMIVSKGEDGALAKEMYDGAVDYTSIAKFLQGVLGVEVGGDEIPDKPSSNSKPSAEEKKKEPPQAPKPALPVRPVKLTAGNFGQFCTAEAPKLHGQQPACVISFSESVNLEELHSRFQNEAALFFSAPSNADDDAKRASYADQLNAALVPNTPIRADANDVLVLRPAKSGAKFVVLQNPSTEAVDAALQKLFGGELTMEKRGNTIKLSE